MPVGSSEVAPLRVKRPTEVHVGCVSAGPVAVVVARCTDHVGCTRNVVARPAEGGIL